MAFSSLDVYNSTSAAQEKSQQTFGSLMQNAYEDAASGIKESAQINLGVMQSAIGAEQVALDSWFKQEQVKKQSQQIGLQAQELQLKSRQMDLMQDYHQQEIDVSRDKLEEKERLANQSQQNRLAISTLNTSQFALKQKSTNLKSLILSDTSQLNKLVGAGPDKDPISLLTPTNDQILAQKTQVPILQDRILKNQQQLERVNGNLDTIAGTASLLQQGGDPNTLIKGISSILAPIDLHPDSYPETTGDPVTNEQSVNRNIIGQTSDDFESFDEVDNPNPDTASVDPSVFKMDAEHAQTRINAFINAEKTNEARGYPAIRQMVENQLNPQAQSIFRNRQTSILKQLANTAYSDALNPSSNNQKLEKLDLNLQKDFYRAGGDPAEYEKVKQDFINYGQYAQDGSLPTALIPTQYQSNFVKDATGNTKGLNNFEKNQLGNNLINSYPLFKTAPVKTNVSGNGRYVPGPFTPDASVAIDTSGNKVINIPPSKDLMMDSDEQAGQFIMSSLSTDLKTRGMVDEVLKDSEGEYDDNKIVNTLQNIPAKEILSDDDYHKYVTPFGTNDRKLDQAKRDKIKKLVSGNSYDQIEKILYNHYDNQNQPKPTGIGKFIDTKALYSALGGS